MGKPSDAPDSKVGSEEERVSRSTFTSNAFNTTISSTTLAAEFCEFFYNGLIKRNISVRCKNAQFWKRDFDNFIKVDGRPPDEIRRILTWLIHQCKDIENFDTPEKIRKNYVLLTEKTESIEEMYIQKKKQIENFLDRLVIPIRLKFKIQLHQVQIFDKSTKKNYYFRYIDEQFENKLVMVSFQLGCHIGSRNASNSLFDGPYLQQNY